jgi:hypothetical protein
VDVAAHRHGALHEVHVALFQEQVGDARAQRLHLALWEVLALPDLA